MNPEKGCGKGEKWLSVFLEGTGFVKLMLLKINKICVF